jgi:hypothetical protein
MANVSAGKRAPATALLFLLAVCDCSSSSSSEEKKPDLADCAIRIERFKELAIVDDAVVRDARTNNAANGPWSFRHAITSLMSDRDDPSTFVLSWFSDWADTSQVNGYPTDVESRVDGMKHELICPWLKWTPENGCNTDCTACTARKLDLAKAPFRLIGIVNRIDLRERPDPDAKSLAGEGRLIFALTNGPADDPQSAPRAMSVIFEYGLPNSGTPKEWADAWHHLGTHATLDEEYRRELEQLTERFVKRGAVPENPNGSALAQLRTNESVFNWIWQLRQFRLDGGGALRLVPVTNTPAEAINNSTALRDYVAQNIQAIKEDRHILPKTMLAGSADQFRFRWNVPGADEATRTAFSRGTCNGCHSQENPPLDTAFHMSPFRTGTDKLSPFVNNPANPANDDLGRREVSMKKLLCAQTP